MSEIKTEDSKDEHTFYTIELTPVNKEEKPKKETKIPVKATPIFDIDSIDDKGYSCRCLTITSIFLILICVVVLLLRIEGGPFHDEDGSDRPGDPVV